jgi:hypothetical protein
MSGRGVQTPWTPPDTTLHSLFSKCKETVLYYVIVQDNIITYTAHRSQRTHNT